MSERFIGPYDVGVHLLDVADALVSPLRANVSLLVNSRGASNPARLMLISDGASATVAEGRVPFDMDKETQAKAAQWLLDLCCTRYGIEGVEFKHSDFKLTFKSR
ncbi:hypothetical protein UFOVP228_26 [uncultured Caudovirales phage]|uniref:Uncharacterized protein n=1 Tax=uncultured Caudovirales phage TaxID=2100421 RepID=A0A6J5T8W9_9CAUD|nr:hypothetical protein UFOVP47_76 [uncultured Caudovirales phage]CAB5219106.1 hypothetical protein UFOVP228_26 [uncultured Caudovirales phage]